MTATPPRPTAATLEVHDAYRRGRLRLAAVAALLAVFSVFAWNHLELSFGQVAGGVERLGRILRLFFPPTHAGFFGDMMWALLETLGIAFMGTLLAALLAVPLGFLGARNVVTTFLLRFSLRRVFDVGRAVDTLIWALICITVVGLGPLAGVLALMLNDTGTLSKLFAEHVENVDETEIEGVRATGAGPLQTIVKGYMPQLGPLFLSNVLYFFESNVRSAAAIGIVGAGGIGQMLASRIQVALWQDACFIIIVVLITVAIVDTLSKILRMRLIDDPRLHQP